MHEEVVQLSRQEQRQEQRDLKRQQKRPQESQNQQQQNDAVHGNDTSVPLPRRDRHSQQRPNRPNRHRDQSVLNETPVAVEAASNPQQLKVDVIDTPRTEPMNTALIVNIDQGQSEIVALNPQQTTAPAPQAEPVKAVVEAAETTAPVQAEQVAAETTPVEEATQAPAKRASNDPRSRPRQRGAQSSQKVAAKIAPSQIPALGQYTMGGLIRHIYGEDCKFLIEQFGLVTTFNRALQKFAEQYASTLVVETAAEEKRPVTRDVELPSQKPTEEAEPAPVLPLTPPEASASRVANDPRERRRLAKLAAEQAKEEHLASNIAPTAPVVESTETTQEVQETAIEAVVAQNTVGDAAPEQQALALANEEMPVVVEETAPVEAVESAQAAVETETAVVTEAVEAVQTIENTEPVASTEETDVEDEAAKAEKEKSSRPRRPRGRPPKKSIVGNE